MNKYKIITTATMDEAVFVTGTGRICYVPVPDAQDESEKKAIAVWYESNYKIIARLRLKIDKTIMRIYLPKRVVPEWSEELPLKEKQNFNYRVLSRFAFPPLEPLPTNLPDVFYMPVVYVISHSNIATWGIQEIYRKVSLENLKTQHNYVKTRYYDEYFKKREKQK